MHYLSKIIVTLLLLLSMSELLARGSVGGCCGGIGGIRYCDASAGRYVCKNGDYSTCYCTRHAVMDLQLLEGCCLWKGGVFKHDPSGLVICNNGGISDNCSIQRPVKAISYW